MCKTLCYHSIFAKDGGSFEADLCACRTVLDDEALPESTYRVVVDFKEGELVMDFEFDDRDLLLAIELLVSVNRKRKVRVIQPVLERLEREIWSKVPPYRQDEFIERQIIAYIRRLPALHKECRNLPITRRGKTLAVAKEIDREIVAIRQD